MTGSHEESFTQAHAESGLLSRIQSHCEYLLPASGARGTLGPVLSSPALPVASVSFFHMPRLAERIPPEAPVGPLYPIFVVDWTDGHLFIKRPGHARARNLWRKDRMLREEFEGVNGFCRARMPLMKGKRCTSASSRSKVQVRSQFRRLPHRMPS